MKVKPLLFVVFTVSLFALGVLVTTLFNTAPTTRDAVVMFYGSLFIALFGVVTLILVSWLYLRTRVAVGSTVLKSVLRQSLIIDGFAVVLLALKANNVLNWATSMTLAALTLIAALILVKRNVIGASMKRRAD